MIIESRLFQDSDKNNSKYGQHTEFTPYLNFPALQVVKSSNNDQVTVIGCCVTLVEAMRAAEKLAADGISIRIIDPFTIKPLDKDTILNSARATGGRIITVEDHYEWGTWIVSCFPFTGLSSVLKN